MHLKILSEKSDEKILKRYKLFNDSLKTFYVLDILMLLLYIMVIWKNAYNIFFGIQSYVFAADIAAFDVDVFFSCGDKVTAEIGGNLNVESQQDTDNYTAKDKNFGIDIGIDKKPQGSGIAFGKILQTLIPNTVV